MVLLTFYSILLFQIAKDARECVQECVSEFISFITSEASDRCHMEKRKTINGEDILFAMTTLGFDNYVEPLKLYLQKYREVTKGDKILQQELAYDEIQEEAFSKIFILRARIWDYLWFCFRRTDNCRQYFDDKWKRATRYGDLRVSGSNSTVSIKLKYFVIVMYYLL